MACDARIEVIAQHAVEGLEVHVGLPSTARFRHLRRALGKCLGTGVAATGMQFLTRDDNGFRGLKDGDHVGDLRRVLVVEADFQARTADEVELHDSEVSDSEILHPQQLDDDRGAGVSGDAAEDDLVAETRRAEASALLLLAARRARRRILTGTGFLGAAKNKNLTRKQAFEMQQELYDGFADLDFQQRLRELYELAQPVLAEEGLRTVMTRAELSEARQALLLEVQRQVLPRYGFEGTAAGVVKMIGAMAPFIKDKEFKQRNEEINALIGLHSPPETWRSLTKACYSVQFKDLTAEEGRKVRAQIEAESVPTTGELSEEPGRPSGHGTLGLRSLAGPSPQADQQEPEQPSPLKLEVGMMCEVKATVTVRATADINSEFWCDLRPGIVVRIAELAEGDPSRAKVKTDIVEGWISLATKSGKPFLARLADGSARASPAAATSVPSHPPPLAPATAPSAVPSMQRLQGGRLADGSAMASPAAVTSVSSHPPLLATAAAAPSAVPSVQRLQGGRLPEAAPPAPAATAAEAIAPQVGLFIAGTFNEFTPQAMSWDDGMYFHEVTVGTSRCESFQLLVDGRWEQTIYPSIKDAATTEAWRVCGPDAFGHGKNWQIGKGDVEPTVPGTQFVVVALLSDRGGVDAVSWQPL